MAEKVKDDAPASADGWKDALSLAKKEFGPWMTRGEKIVQRYRDDRTDTDQTKRYNILWSNIRTLLPAVYAKKPKAQADRRYKDADPVGRTAAQILERCLQYEIDHYSDFDSALRNAVLDRLLPGRGVAWVRYEEHKAEPEAGEEPAPQAAVEGASTGAAKPDGQITDDVETPGKLLYECSPCDYVFWKDFRHSPARTWEEVTWVARRVYMSKAEGLKRFGDAFKDVPMTHEPIGLKDLRDSGATSSLDEMKKGVVWEIWSKPDRQVIWMGEGCGNLLDEKDDPLELDDFFPCPKPIYATLTTDTLVPVPDYAEYQDQADELDNLTARIGMLVKAVKIVGVYDAGSTALARLLNEGTDNEMIPVDTWAMFAEKGGIKGAVDFFPIDMVIKALNELYAARERCKQVIYEVTGMSDIIRGASNPNETLGAQEIKANYAGLRLKEMQGDVARFASDLLRTKAQIMCSFYRPESLLAMSGINGTQDAKYAQEAIKLLQSEPLRSFKIEVATDSLVELDERAEQQSRTQFIEASSMFLEKAVPAAQAIPEIAPVLGEMLMFLVRSFKAGRPMEAAFEEATTKLAAKPAGPTEETKALQAQLKEAQDKLLEKTAESANTAKELDLKAREVAISEKESAAAIKEREIASSTQLLTAASNVVMMPPEVIAQAIQTIAALRQAATKPETRKVARAVKQPDGTFLLESQEVPV